MRQSTISKLREGDHFRILPNQEPTYAMKHDNLKRVLNYSPRTTYKVQKKHKKSVDISLIGSHHLFRIKFDGFFNNYEPAVDVNVNVI